MPAETATAAFTPRFKIGDAVYRRKFVDSVTRQPVDAIRGLTVSRVEIVESDSPIPERLHRKLPTYARVTAVYASGHTACEGAERFFDFEIYGENKS